MAQKKSYSRYFIILQEDERGYALASDKLPTGYVKLELKNDKCKVSYYVQNLKKEAAPYYMALILGKKDTNKIIKMGELNIDNYGRSEVSYEYLADNIADTGMSMDNVSGAAIVKLLDKNIISVLSGFLTSDIPKWREYEIIEAAVREEKVEELHERVETKLEEKIETRAAEEEKNIFDKYEESIEQSKQQAENLKVDTVVEEEHKEKPVVQAVNKEEDVQEAKQVDEVTNLDKESNLRNNVEEKIIENEDMREDRRNKDWPKGRTGEFFKEIAKGLKEVTGEIEDIKRCIWYKVPVKDINDMYCISNYNKYAVMYYPMINYCNYIMPYGHYIIGYKCDKEGKMKYLIYGIPGGKDKKYQPFDGKSGFVTWVPSKSGKNECEGYWLMFYDFRTCTILIPVK